ncbi:MAG: S8 family serine peptidase, partial [Balneolaceae bacterium]
MKEIRYLSILLVLIFTSNIIAQPAQHDNLPNGFLVKFKPGVNLEEIRAKNILRADNGIREGEYFEYLDIWYIKYEPAKISKEEALQTLRNDPSILRSNPIRKVEYRSAIPNDEDFGDQWALSNTGQTGGTPGADIKALQAWDLTKGNSWVTHEPILAVVDEGFDQTHEDLEFLSGGYDAYDDDFTVPVDDHGTHVSGILGAKANNIDGVAGVNWDTRIFPVAGSDSDELVVTRAYDHILGLRQQYNSSGGSQGCYIVATNSSFGIDEADPDDYEDWCSYYDLLGSAGIVSIAATANRDYDVDVVGDVPTGCSSDYLIAVTNTDHNDDRNSGAAYGSTSVDLGAPGTNILSTVPTAFGTYASYSGTSMAAPHVTGIVGLIYSVLPSTTISNSLT